MNKKGAEIKLYVTKDMKELIKKIAKNNDSSMNEYIITMVNEDLNRREEKVKYKLEVENRVAKTESKIQDIKNNMKKRRINHHNKIIEEIINFFRI